MQGHTLHLDVLFQTKKYFMMSNVPEQRTFGLRVRVRVRGEGEHTLHVALTLKLTQQSSNKRTRDIHELNRVKGLKGV